MVVDIPIIGYMTYCKKLDSSPSSRSLLREMYGLESTINPNKCYYSSNQDVSKKIDIKKFISYWESVTSTDEITIDPRPVINSLNDWYNVGTDIFNIFIGAYPDFISLGSKKNGVLENLYNFGKENGIFTTILQIGSVNAINKLSSDSETHYKPTNWNPLLETCGTLSADVVVPKYNTIDLYDNINLRSWCGCFTKTITFNKTPDVPNFPKTFPNSCLPTCIVPEAVKLLDPENPGDFEQCNASVCVIDDITIQVYESSGGPITFNQICTACISDPSSPCICIVQADLDGSRIGEGSEDLKVNFNQVCPFSVCFKQIGDDGNPDLTAPFECPSTTPGGSTGGGNTGGGGEKPQPGQDPRSVTPRYIVNTGTVLTFFIILFLILLFLSLSSFVSTKFLPIHLPKVN